MSSSRESPAPGFAPGQRWHSTTEPELGLGLVAFVDRREVVIDYPARGVVRRYSIEHAPLARAWLTEGQRARGGGAEFVIEQVEQDGELLVYRGQGQSLRETELDAELDVATPENRMRSGQVDDPRLFDLRADALAIRHRMLASPARGFLGGRIELFDHQLSVARDVCERHRVRVLLADEVGLGKTIEVLLILHRMLLSGRVERALVLVPPALVHQWLAEAYLRFNLVLRVIGRELEDELFEPGSAELPSVLMSAQLYVGPLGEVASAALLRAPWDLVIVDEAHHLEAGSEELALVEALAESTEHVVLLSATPDRDGEVAHFRRLALLDPDRFHDLDAYRGEAERYRELADTAERLHAGMPPERADRELLRVRLVGPDVDELIAAAGAAGGEAARATLLGRLLDLHGIGRVMFRNVRARIAGFPRRVPCPAELEGGDAARLRREFLHDLGRDDRFRLGGVAGDPRTAWLRQLCAARPDEKVLALCSTHTKVEAFAQALGTRRREVARFHERMSNLERDRQAAWFLGVDGPQLLISSAIGAEGRNFQVARNLVLLDLPLGADRLEQIIGRVDRIGQGDEIHIYVPVLAGTPQARLRRWYDEALDVFRRPWHGSPVIDRELGAALLDALLAEDEAATDALIERGRRRNQEIAGELERGRDRLLELASFDAAAARELSDAIHHAELSRELDDFMIEAFERAGLDTEPVGPRSHAVRAGARYHRPFPGFSGSEMTVTFDRGIGLEHPDRVLLTWDHGMVRDAVDTLLAHDTGNACLARRAGRRPGLLLEALFLAEPLASPALRADRFFPPTPIRVVVNGRGEAVALDAVEVRAELQPLDAHLLEDGGLRDLVGELVEHARARAEERAPRVAAEARRRMRQSLEPVVVRLGELAAVNPQVTVAEVEAARAELAALDEQLGGVRVRLDALRLIVTPAT